MSPPTASTFLKEAEKQESLLSRRDRVYIYYRANKESSLFKDLARAYWRLTLKYLLKEFGKDFLFKKPILFGSIAKVENTAESDLDIFVDIEKRNINFEKIEKKLNRKIQIHYKNVLKNKNFISIIEKGWVIE